MTDSKILANSELNLNLGQDLSQRPKRISHRRRANELDGKTWLQYSISVWNDIKKSKEEIELRHPAMFPSALAERLIKAFTTDRQKNILDPFAGIGSTLLAAQALGKHGIGFDVCEEYVRIARHRLEQRALFGNKNYELYCKDVRNLFDHVRRDSIDLCITSPPYWNILSQKRTADSKEIRDYAEKSGNLGNIADYDAFLRELKVIFAKVKEVLKPLGRCCVVVMDIRKGPKFYPFHMNISQFMTEDLGFILEDIIIWDRRLDYSNLRPLGYPSVFRINKIHEYILIFQKPKQH
ncbi:MAG: TRM11 family SAM-dependent methyltransferase [Candidatus Brocadiales bacterium]